MLAYWLVLGFGAVIIALMAFWLWAGRAPQQEEPNVLNMTDEERDRKLDDVVRRIEG